MIIKSDFYNRNTVKIAQDLLGCFLVREYKGKIIRAVITEVEAYRGFYDLASHAARGKTERNAIMFGQSGRAYIYLIYGMHNMLNIVTEEKDFPAAVLIRGVKTHCNASLQKKLIGPGKLTKFLHIDKTLNDHDLTRGGKLWLEYPPDRKKIKILKSPRVGVDYAKHCKSWKWNFKITNYELDTKIRKIGK